MMWQGFAPDFILYQLNNKLVGPGKVREWGPYVLQKDGTYKYSHVLKVAPDGQSALYILPLEGKSRTMTKKVSREVPA